MDNYKNYFIGVDIGGGTIKFGIFGSSVKGKKLLYTCIDKTLRVTTQSEKVITKQIIDRVKYLCDNKVKGINANNLSGIGIAVPGPVVNNKILKAVNLNWKKEYDIAKAIKKELGDKIKVLVLNDANAAALGEYYFSLKDKYKSICFITLGTGVGAGIIIDGKLVEGKNGIAGELGHIKVDYSQNGVKCSCGNKGCLETIVSGKGIADSYNRKYNTDIMKGAADVIKRAKKNDKKALTIVEYSFDCLSDIIYMLMLVYDLEVVLIGGGVSNEGVFVTNIIKKHLKKKIFMTNKLPKILIARLKNKAGIYGAVAML